MTDTSWVKSGALAAIIQQAPYEYEEVVIVKVGKRDVVLDNGERFNVGRLSKMRGTWDPTRYLVARSSPEAEEARTMVARDRLHMKVTRAGSRIDLATRQGRYEDAARVCGELLVLLSGSGS